MEDEHTTSATAEAGRQPEVVDATWLSRSILLVVGCPDLDPGDTRATLFAGDDSFEVGVRCISLGLDRGSSERKVLTAAIDDNSSSLRSADKLSIGAKPIDDGRGVAELRVSELAEVLADRLSGLDGSTARRVIEFISAAAAAHGLDDTSDLELSGKLLVVRNALRERLPSVEIERNQSLSGNVDALVPIDDRAFYVRGWMRDGEAQITRLTAVTPEGERIELFERLFRLPLPEFDPYRDGPWAEPVDAMRFVSYFETTRPSRLRRAWVFEIRNEVGRAVEMYALPDIDDTAAARTKILSSVPASVLPDEQLMSSQITPAVERIESRVRESIRIATTIDYGKQEESPDISIVVPLYRRIDLVEHQLLQFARDPDVRTEELIYVLDSPELDKQLADAARQLAHLYRMPFRIVTMERNVGFGAATNAGVSVARGRLILMLNSDVLPAGPGWLREMRTFYDSTPEIGALGARLLYEDDSLQHAGLFFDMSRGGPTAGSWATKHYFKGLHKDLPAANSARPVPAVTAACLMVEKALFERLGGLPEVYVQGDYEDSELCLKLLEAGRDNWYLPAAELYHLEGSSYPENERGITAAYNRRLQNRKWGPVIEDVMTRYPRL